MAFPANVALVTVTGTFLKSDGSGPASGTVTFLPNVRLTDVATQQLVEQIPQVATLDPSGHFSIQVMATDDTHLSPSGWMYQVVERITGAPVAAYYLPFPAVQTPVDLSTKVQVPVPPAVVAYVLQAALGAAGGVATLDNAGQVPLSQLGNVPGGGGGGGFRGVWSGATAYSIGDIVTVGQVTYGALVAGTNHPPQPTRTYHVNVPGVGDSGQVDGGDAAAYEMGVKFSVSQMVWMSGITFYKGAANTPTGTRLARLWNPDSGLLLAQSSFATETASGYQTAPLAYQLWPGTNYVASIGVPNGHYSVLIGGYNAPVTNGSVTAPVGAGRFNTVVGQLPASISGNSDYYVSPVWLEPGDLDAHWAILGRS